MNTNSSSNAYVAGCKAMETRDYTRAALAFDRAILDSPDSPVYYNAAAVTACLLGQYRRAENLYKHAIAAAKTTFGHDSALVGNVTFGLVDLYQNQGRYDEAEIQCRELLDQLQDSATNALRSRVMLRLAGMHRQRRQLPDAEIAYLQAIEMRKQAFGAEHERVIEILPDLAALYHDMGREDDAEMLSHRVQMKSLEAA